MVLRALATPVGYNWVSDDVTGFFARWGMTEDEDPIMSPVGPEILDIEVSTICHGHGVPCAWCYKSNTPAGYNMSLDTFTQIFDKITNKYRNLTQIAFGIGDIDANPDLYGMFAYSRVFGVVPNLTINGYRMNDTYYDMLVRLCGAVAVSHYDDDTCFSAVHELTTRGLRYVNIHKLLSTETLADCHRLIDQTVVEPRLAKLNAIVFLLLKPKGRRNKLTSIQDLNYYQELFDHASKAGVQFGLDSCSAPSLLKSTEGKATSAFDLKSVEPCESTLFSLYVNVDAEVFPCSFCEGQPGWESGIPILEADDFVHDVWLGSRLVEWRDKLLNQTNNTICNTCIQKPLCRACPEFDINICRR